MLRLEAYGSLATFVARITNIMANGRFVAYYRVSTERQGRSGLGEAAQRAAVADYLNGGRWTVLAEFTEIESGANNERPELARAMTHCRLTGAQLVIAKLDRLSRDAAFLMGLEKSGISFVAADMPSANTLTVGILAVVAQEERKLISERTKAALKAAKARGQVLGGVRANHRPVDGALGAKAVHAQAVAFADTVRPTVRRLRDGGLSLRAVAAALDAQSIRRPRGGSWTAEAVMQVLR